MVLEQYVMPSDASRRDAHLPDTTLVEGYVVEHALRWKSNSVAGYLNAGGGIDVGAGAPADVAQLQRAPKVSVTLSEYLSAASPHADPSCDYGWYTPTASASSLPAAENSAQEGCYPAPPSPSAYPSSLPWRCNRVEVESTATFSLSPESIVLGGGGGSSSTKVHEANGCANSGRGKNLPGDTPTVRFEENSSSSNGGGGGGSFSTRKPQQQQEQHQLALVPRSCNVSFGGGIGGGRGGDSSGARASGQGLIEANEGAAEAESSAGSIGVRLLPVKKARSTTTHLNSWHPLYPTVSSSGRLSAASCSGRCTMHIRRTSFSISTRHFPEKPPTPPKKRRSDRIARSCSSWGSGRPLNGSPLLQGRGRDRAAAPAAAAAIQQEEQQQQQQQRESPKASRPKSYSWAVTEIRVIRPDLRFPLGPAPAYAQYLVVVCMGREKLVAGWRRASDFEKLAAIARKAWMPKSCVAWEALERARRVDGGGPCNMPVVLRPRRLDSVYLQNKARFLEEFLKQYFFEAGSKDALLSFLDLKKPATAEV